MCSSLMRSCSKNNNIVPDKRLRVSAAFFGPVCEKRENSSGILCAYFGKIILAYLWDVLYNRKS